MGVEKRVFERTDVIGGGRKVGGCMVIGRRGSGSSTRA